MNELNDWYVLSNKFNINKHKINPPPTTDVIIIDLKIILYATNEKIYIFQYETQNILIAFSVLSTTTKWDVTSLHNNVTKYVAK